MNFNKMIIKGRRAVKRVVTPKTLTCMSFIGTFATAGVSFRSGMKIQKKIDDGTFEKKDILKECWGMGVTTIATAASGLGAGIGYSKLLASASMEIDSLRRDFDAFKKQTKETVSDEMYKQIKKDAEKDVANQLTSQEPTPDANGYFWYKDDFTGACFYTKESYIWKAWNRVSNLVKNGNEQVVLTDFYSEIVRRSDTGLNNSMIKEFGWDGNDIYDCQLTLDTEGVTEMANGYPCKRIRYPSVKPHVLKERRYSR